MNKIFIILILLISLTHNAFAKQKCSDLPGFKKVGKDSIEYIKCLKDSKKLKLKTESKLTDVITGKEKLKLPNPLDGLKSIGKALKPSALEK